MAGSSVTGTCSARRRVSRPEQLPSDGGWPRTRLLKDGRQRHLPPGTGQPRSSRPTGGSASREGGLGAAEEGAAGGGSGSGHFF